MSNKMITAAMEYQAGSAIKKLILIKLADNANDDGICWPTYKTIARHCEIDRATVIRHINQLEKQGVIVRQKRVTYYGNTSNIFQLCLPNLENTRGRSVQLGGSQKTTRGVAENNPEPSIEPPIEPKELMSSQQADTTFDFEQVKQAYNEFANSNGLATIRAVTDKKKREVRNAYKVYCKIRKATGKEPVSGNEFVSGYLAIVQSLMTDFHTGQNKNNWKAGFDYFFATDIVENVLNENKLSRK